MKKIALILVSLLACFFVLTACGEKKNSDGGESKSTESIAVTETAVDTAQDAEAETDKETEAVTDAHSEMTREELVGFISGLTWYDYCYGGISNSEKVVYTIEFTPNSDEMMFKAGYYASEWMNACSGKYVIGDDGVFSAELYDEICEKALKMTFDISVICTDETAKEISMTVISTDPEYDLLVGKTFEFSSDEAPSYDD